MRSNSFVTASASKIRLVFAILVSVLLFGGAMVIANAQTVPMTYDMVAWSPDGQTIAVAGQFGIHLYTSSLQDAATQFKNAGVVNNISWSPDSRKLASANADYSVRIWDAKNGKLINSLQGHTDQVWAVTWSPDGTKLASAANDAVLIWDGTSGQLLRALRHPDGANGVAWSPDGSKLVTAVDGLEVSLWEPDTGNLIYSNQGSSVHKSISWSADSLFFVLDGPEIYDAKDGSVFDATLCSEGSNLAGTWSLDGSKIAFVGTHSGGVDLCVLDAKSREPVMTTDVEHISSVALSPNGNRVVATEGSGQLQMWEVATGNEIANTSAIIPTPVSRSQKLHLTALCSLDPAKSRLWRIDNPNPFEVVVDWTVNDADIAQNASATNQRGRVVVPASQSNLVIGARLFSTLPEPEPNMVSIFSPPDALQDKQTSITLSCADYIRWRLSACVTDKGLLNSLSAKLDVGQYGAFVNEIQAQSGKKISTACSTELIQTATYLQSHSTTTPVVKKTQTN